MSPKGAALLVLAFLEDEKAKGKHVSPKGTSFCARGRGPSGPALGARVEPGGLALVPGELLPSRGGCFHGAGAEPGDPKAQGKARPHGQAFAL